MGFREACELVAKSFFFSEHDQLERPSLLHVAAILVVEKIVDRPDPFVRPSAQERLKILFYGVVGQLSSQNCRGSGAPTADSLRSQCLGHEAPVVDADLLGDQIVQKHVHSQDRRPVRFRFERKVAHLLGVVR
jgi:hypothetical protein